MVVTAPSEEDYGRICFYNMSYIQGGMNEHGLFYDGASCPPSEVSHYSDRENLDYNLGDIVLAKCASVEEVEKFFENYNIPSVFTIISYLPIVQELLQYLNGWEESFILFIKIGTRIIRL